MCNGYGLYFTACFYNCFYSSSIPRLSPLTCKATLAVILTQYHFLLCSCLTNSAMTPGPSLRYTNFTSPLSSKNKLSWAWKHTAQGSRRWDMTSLYNILVISTSGRESGERCCDIHTSPAAHSFPLESWRTFHASSLSLDLDCLSICHFLLLHLVYIPSFLSVPTLPRVQSIFYLTVVVLCASTTCTRLLKTLTAETGAAQGQFPECCSPLALI